MPLWLFWLLPLTLTATTTASPLADHGPYHQSSAYDTGGFGSWPTETYRSSPLLGPSLNYIEHSPLCDDDGLYTLLAPRGYNVRTAGPMIIDHEGKLVWTKDYGQSHAVGVYTVGEREFLTFGVENDGIRGFGDGVYYMLDSSYKEAYKVKGANGLPVDLREFHITRDETALISAYEITSSDLRSLDGPQDGWIYDCIVQEIDIDTGKLLFQWRASEHVDFTLSPSPRDAVTYVNHIEAWDFFHLNSIDKDGKGNFLVSSGTTNSVKYIDGTTGNIIWTLGGKNNSFEDLSNGAATQFSGQHHARFQDNGTAITLFDNNAAGSDYPSRGLYLDLNQDDMTVAIRHEYTNSPSNIHSPSDGGSIQILDSGNVLQGYGLDPVWTEYTMDGDVLCHVHFGPAFTFGQGRVTSDRVTKFHWTGLPKTSPDIALYGYEAAVSWNGATEVKTYVLQGTNDPDLDKKKTIPHNNEEKDFTFLTALPKTGYETILPIPSSTTITTTTHFRILALNAHGDILGITKLTPWDPTADQPIIGTGGPASPGIDMRPFTFFVIGFLVAAVAAVGVWVGRRKIAARRVYRRINRGRRKGNRAYEESDSDSDDDREVDGGMGWDDEDAELSDGELIDAVEFSLLGGRALRARGLRGLDEDEDDDEIEVGDGRKGPP